MDDRGGEMGMTLVPRQAPQVEGWWLGAYVALIVGIVGYTLGFVTAIWYLA
jgi:hypothetical protein